MCKGLNTAHTLGELAMSTLWGLAFAMQLQQMCSRCRDTNLKWPRPRRHWPHLRASAATATSGPIASPPMSYLSAPSVWLIAPHAGLIISRMKYDKQSIAPVITSNGLKIFHLLSWQRLAGITNGAGRCEGAIMGVRGRRRR